MSSSQKEPKSKKRSSLAGQRLDDHKDAEVASKKPKDMNMVECFEEILERFQQLPESFRKEKIDPILTKFLAAKNKATVITVVGKTGFGKTRLVNSIIGDKIFPERNLDRLFSCTMIPIVIRYGQTYTLTERRFADESGQRCLTFSRPSDLSTKLAEINAKIEQEMTRWLRRGTSAEQALDNEAALRLSCEFVEVTVPSRTLQDMRAEIIDFPGMTSEAKGPLLKENISAMLNYLHNDGRFVDAIFVGCHRDQTNPFLAPHKNEKKLLEWYGFFAREYIVNTPLICFLDNFWQNEGRHTVKSFIEKRDFLLRLAAQFIACITGKPPRNIGLEALEDVGIAGFGRSYVPIFSPLYYDQFWTLHKKSPDGLIKKLRKQFCHIDVHEDISSWFPMFNEAVQIAGEASRQANVRKLYALDFQRIVKNKSSSKFRPTFKGPSVVDHSPRSILTSNKKTIKENLKLLLLNYAQSEDLNVEWNDAEPGSDDAWKVFVTAYVDRFLFSDATDSILSLYANILCGGFQSESPQYFAEELTDRLEPFRLTQKWITILGRKRITTFTIDHENVFRSLSSFEENEDQEFANRALDEVVQMLTDKRFFNIADVIFDEIQSVFNKVSDEYAKVITDEVAVQLTVAKSDVKSLMSRITTIIKNEGMYNDGLEDGEAGEHNDVSLRRCKPSEAATNFFAYCPANLINPNLDFENNEQVAARYAELKQHKVFLTKEKFYRDRIFCRENDTDSFTMAKLVDINIVPSHSLNPSTMILELGIGTLHVETIQLFINSKDKQVEVSKVSDELKDLNAPIFIPSYLVLNEETQNYRNVNYFFDSIIFEMQDCPTNGKVGPFFVVIEEWHKHDVLNVMKEQMDTILAKTPEVNRPNLKDIQAALSKHLRIICVKNVHIGVGRARDLCRLMAIHMNARNFFIVHDDIQTIAAFIEESSAMIKNSLVPIRAFRCMVDCLDCEVLDFTSNFDDVARGDLLDSLEQELGINRRNHRKDVDAVEMIVDKIIQTPFLLLDGSSLDHILAFEFGELNRKYPGVAGLIKQKFESFSNEAICQVALLSAARNSDVLCDASKRRSEGYTHGLSSMLYECTLYRTKPCRRVSFLAIGAFFDDDMEGSYQTFKSRIRDSKYKEFMPIQGWLHKNNELSDQTYYAVLNHSIKYGYRYEDHAFHERLMLRGYTGVVMYNFQMIPFGKQTHAVEDHPSIVGNKN
jgi:hypothetical protein